MPTVVSMSPTPACAPGRLVRGWLIAVLLCQAAPLAAQVAAGSQAAQHVVQDATERFFAAIEREGERAREPERAHALVEQHISPHVDTELVARLILGRHWRTASEQQRTSFIDAFKWMLLRTYSIAVEDFSGVDIRYLPAREQTRDGEVEVRTQISHKGGPPVAVNYRMHQRDGQWLVFDLAIQGVSMVATYRGTFAAEINRHGLDGLIERIGQRRAGAAAADTSG
jgi:phospholipid transport system substrate-binding protein